MTRLDHLACALVDQAAIQSVPDMTDAEVCEVLSYGDNRTDDLEVLRAHLERVLAILTEVGGYLSQEHQEVIRRAREAVR